MENIETKDCQQNISTPLPSHIRWGILGCSRISEDFCVAMQLCPSHKVVAVASKSGERAKEFADKFSILTFYDSYEGLLRDAEVDIVYVGTVTSLHYHCSLQVLKAGKALLCEKMLCMTVKQCRMLLETANKHKVLMVEGLWSSFHPSYHHLRASLEGKEIGEVTEINIQFGSKFSVNSQLYKKELGGGATFGLGCYALYLAGVVMGGGPVRVVAQVELDQNGLDVKTQILLEYEGARKAEIRLSLLEDYSNEAVIKGSDGEIKMKKFWRCEEIEVNGVLNSYPFPPPLQATNYPSTVGFKYEIERVGKGWRRGELEVGEVSHASSVILHEVFDQVLSQVNVKYGEALNM